MREMEQHSHNLKLQAEHHCQIMVNLKLHEQMYRKALQRMNE